MEQVNNQGDIYGEKVSFYSDSHPNPNKRTALNVQFTFTRGRLPTLSLEIAPLSESGGAPLWEHKKVIQLTKQEQVRFCKLLFGLAPELKASFHGDNRNKSIAAYDNGAKGVGIVISERGDRIEHFLDGDGRLELGVFAVRRLSEAWKVTPSDVLAILRQSVALDRK